MSAITPSTATVAAPALADAAFHLHAKSLKDKAEATVAGQVPAGQPSAGLFSSILQAAGMIAKL